MLRETAIFGLRKNYRLGKVRPLCGGEPTLPLGRPADWIAPRFIECLISSA